MPEAINSALLRMLADARKQQGVSMEALGERAGLDRSYVGRLERGERKPTVVAAIALSNALGLSLADLLLRAERVAAGDDGSDARQRLELVSAPKRRLATPDNVESDEHLQQ